jgi:hypothetical protein
MQTMPQGTCGIVFVHHDYGMFCLNIARSRATLILSGALRCELQF